MDKFFIKILNGLSYYAHDYWNEVSDPRSRDLFMMSNGPWKVFAVMSFYLLFVTKIGPELMKGREPYQLRSALLVYNSVVVLINSYFFYIAVYYLDYGNKLLDFKFPDKNDPKFYSDHERKILWLAYLYGWTKVLDLMDTIFFVLRKKYSQITGLHLYHHAIMPVFAWLVIKIAPTATCLGIFPLINTLIHIIMYSYYGLSALGPGLQPYLWWKKYLTQLQLAQFVIFAIYAIIFVIKQEGYPMGVWLAIGFPQPFIFGVMFYNFYRRSYQKSIKISFKGNENNNENSFYMNSIKGETFTTEDQMTNTDRKFSDKKIK